LVDQIGNWFRIGHVAVSKENGIGSLLSGNRKEGERNVKV
jgi:hypothetical protein